MKSPDYGRGAEYVCHGCDPYGRRFVVNGSAGSIDARARSRAYGDATASLSPGLPTEGK